MLEKVSSTTLALVLHELTTNSAKYGSLSVASGTLDVSCNAQDDEVVIMWTERGGPPRWKALAANWCIGA
jgi:two-component sensor histidine kinase